MIFRIEADFLFARCLRAILAVLTLGATGCASVTSHRAQQFYVTPGETAPAIIYVAPFAAPVENLRVDRSGESLAAFQAQFSAKLRDSLARQIDRSVAPTKILTGSDLPPRSNAWLIVGQFDRVEQGSRALRATIGFGFGGTKVNTTAIVYNLSTPKPTPIMTIETTGGSNAAPGTVVNLTGLVSIGPAGVALAAGTGVVTGISGIAFGAGTGAIPGLGDDARRTAREITAQLSTFFYERGWIPEKQVMHPKKPGSGSIRLGDPKRPQPDA